MHDGADPPRTPEIADPAQALGQGHLRFSLPNMITLDALFLRGSRGRRMSMNGL